MTFAQLFETAISKVADQKYEGRTAAIDAVVYNNLTELFGEEVKKSKWTQSHCSNPYGKDDPSLHVYAHGCNRSFPFKVRLKTNGKKHSYFGDITYYTPSVAFLCNEEMMDRDIVECLNQIYDEAQDIKEKIAEEEATKLKKSEYQDLVNKMSSVIEEFNNLPLEIRRILRTDIPDIAYYY